MTADRAEDLALIEYWERMTGENHSISRLCALARLGLRWIELPQTAPAPAAEPPLGNHYCPRCKLLHADERGNCRRAEPPHMDEVAVNAFARAMIEKLERKRAEGYGGWRDECSADYLREKLRSHVQKGDPVDVANFAMMLWHRNERTAAEPPHEFVGASNVCKKCGAIVDAAEPPQDVAGLVERLAPQFPIIVRSRWATKEDVAENYRRAKEFLALVIREAQAEAAAALAALQARIDAMARDLELLPQLTEALHGQRKRAEQAERERDTLLTAAEAVTWFDWSDNDPDAVLTIVKLRNAVDAARKEEK